jgi:TetR/AcrR family transcriptional repressor of nem operon
LAKRDERKQETRRRMLEAAGRGFRSQGYDGIGVDGLAKGAGVTSGAFYAHFGSKAAAFDAALAAGLDEVIAAIPEYQLKYGDAWTKAFSDYYLGKAHRDDLSGGCAMAAFSPEVIRTSNETRSLYEQKMKTIAGLIAKRMSGNTETERVANAWSYLSRLIGGVTLARAMSSAALSNRILKAAKQI